MTMTRGTPASSQIIFLENRVKELEEQLDAFEMDGVHAANCIKENNKIFDEIEEYLKGLVSVHSSFAAHTKGDFNGKKERIRAAECARLLAYIQKKRKSLDERILG